MVWRWDDDMVNPNQIRNTNLGQAPSNQYKLSDGLRLETMGGAAPSTTPPVSKQMQNIYENRYSKRNKAPMQKYPENAYDQPQYFYPEERRKSKDNQYKLSDGLRLKTMGTAGAETGGGDEPPPVEPPEDIEGKFPTPKTIDAPEIPIPKYKKLRPKRYAKRWGKFTRQEMAKNFETAQGMALKTLETELAGLEKFAPAAGALKRRETALDNIFNQLERTKQIDEALPGFRQKFEDQYGQLEESRGDIESQAERIATQGERADIYATGRAPDEVTDRGLELNVRSRAADRARQGGFGAMSNVARKASDLMSAEQRLQIAQYGENLYSQNIQLGTQNIQLSNQNVGMRGDIMNQQANLLLAPTEYSNAGSQINVMPEVGAGRLTTSMMGELNQYGMIPAGQAASMVINQRQFRANLEQQTNMFNASNQMTASQFNAGAANQFALSKFGYQVAQAGAVAGATNATNTGQFEYAQQQAAFATFGDYMNQAQQAGQAGAISQGFGAIGGILDAISGVSSLFGGGQQPSQGAAGGGGFVTGTGGVGGGITEITPSSTGGMQGTPSGSIVVPEGSVPPGYTPIGSAPTPSGGAGVIVSPNQTPETQGFEDSLGLKIGRPGAQEDTTQTLLNQNAKMLNMSGVSNQPQPGFVETGINNQGQKIYSNARLSSSNDNREGFNLTNTLRRVIDPTGVLDDEDRTALDKVAMLSSSANFLGDLTELQANGDTRGFVNAILERYQQPIIENLAKDPTDQAGLSAAFNAFSLSEHWDKMSAAQRSLGLASIGIQGYRYGTGENLAEKFIIKPPNPDAPIGPKNMGLNVGQALNLMSAGVNSYGLIKNWNQLNALQKVAYGTGNLSQLATLGRQFGLLGKGVSGAAVNVTAQQLTAQGFSHVPAFGPGAIMGSASSKLPEGYTIIDKVANGTRVIAAPGPNAASAVGATEGATESQLMTQAGQGLRVVGGAASIALGVQAVMKNWGTGGGKGALNGALGGSAIAGGLMSMGSGLGVAAMSNPYLLAGVMAVSVLGGLAKTGITNKGQLQRNAVRDSLKGGNFVDDDYNITLADGTKFNIGVDGQEGKHKFRDPSLVVDKGPTEGHSYDIDWTNDLDYMSGMGGQSLMRMLSGGIKDETDKIGFQIGNGALSSVGFGKDMTPENFTKVTTNLRSVYAQAGIKSKSDAYQLSNQMYAEGRISETDMVTMQQSFNMIYDDNGLQTAQALLGGRHGGIQAMAKDPGLSTKPGYQIDPGRTPGAQQPTGSAGATTGKPIKEKPVLEGGPMRLPTDNKYTQRIPIIGEDGMLNMTDKPRTRFDENGEVISNGTSRLQGERVRGQPPLLRPPAPINAGQMLDNIAPVERPTVPAIPTPRRPANINTGEMLEDIKPLRSKLRMSKEELQRVNSERYAEAGA